MSRFATRSQTDMLSQKYRQTLILRITAISLVGMSAIVWFTASQEAQAYRKFCTAPVTTWDAVWLDLRIDECESVK